MLRKREEEAGAYSVRCNLVLLEYHVRDLLAGIEAGRVSPGLSGDWNTGSKRSPLHMQSTGGIRRSGFSWMRVSERVSKYRERGARDTGG